MSKISKLNDEDFIALMHSCASMREALDRLSLVPAGGNYAGIRNRCKKLGIEPKRNTAWNKGKKLGPHREVLTYLVKGGPKIISSKLRQRLINEGLKPNQCEECGLGPIWCGKPLSLHLDHIDGDHFNNELINLRILCPNCHTQTSTYGKIKSRS